MLEGEELQILNDAVSMYERTVGRSLEVGPRQEQEQPSAAAPAVVVEAQGSSGSLRLHGQDVQLTFNHGPWRSQTASTDDWFASEGVLLVGRFQRWALETLPERFRETMVHVSLTLEESCHAADNVKRVHLHAQVTFRQRIDRTSVVDFVFEGARPHVATRSYSEPSQSAVQSHLCVLFGLVGATLLLFAMLLPQEMNKGRGAHVQVSRNRAHFYVYCTKVGTLWSFTNYWPFLDYAVQPFWLMGWWATGKLSNKQYKGYLLKCKKSYRGLLQNFEAVVQSEKALQLDEYRDSVVRLLAAARLPFRQPTDPSLG